MCGSGITDPLAQLDGAAPVDLANRDGLVPMPNGEMRGLTGASRELGQKRRRDLREVVLAPGRRTELKDLRPKPVLATAVLLTHIPEGDQRAEKVERRADVESGLAGDLGDGNALFAPRDHFQNSKASLQRLDVGRR